MISARLWWKVGDDNMLTGEYRHNLDSKGRVIVPAKFREEFGDKVRVMLGYDGNLLLYTEEAFLDKVEKFNKLPETDINVRKILQIQLGASVLCDFDSQGRIQLPNSLIKRAGLTKSCVFVGVLDKVALWDEQRWEDYFNQASENIDQIASSITEYVVK